MANISSLIAPSGVLTKDDQFSLESVSGTTQNLDVGNATFFDAGNLTNDVTLTFSNVPTNAQWSYSFDAELAGSYDIENASYDFVSFSVASQETFHSGLFFKPDGSKMYIVGGYNSSSIYQYSLLTAWDVSTSVYDGVSFSFDSQDTRSRGIFFKPDGTKMYVVGTINDSVYQYSLSTAWDLSTASYDNVSFDVSGQDGNPAGLFFKDDGTKLYVIGLANDSVLQYSLSTAWDLSAASYDNVSFNVNSQTSQPLGVFFKSDGTKMYVVGDNNDSVYQYSTAIYPTITLPASVQNSPSEAFELDRVTYTFFTKDGGTNVHLISEEI